MKINQPKLITAGSGQCPAGWYDCIITDARESESPAGDTRWGIRLEVDQPESLYHERSFWDSLNWSVRGRERVGFVLRRIFDVSNDEPLVLDIDPSALMGRHVSVEVTREEAIDPVTGVRRLHNRVLFHGYRAWRTAGHPLASVKQSLTGATPTCHEVSVRGFTSASEESWKFTREYTLGGMLCINRQVTNVTPEQLADALEGLDG